jgi:hypothetical protein
MNQDSPMTKTLFAALAALGALPAHALINVSSAAFTYSESFDSLTTVATPATNWVNDSTLPGWSLFIASGAAAPTIAADNGGSNAGTFRSYGTTAASDRALGGLGSGGAYFGAPAQGAVAGYIAAGLTNTSALVLDSFTLRFDGEQWRNGGNATAQTMVMEYGFGASFAAVTTWTAPGGNFSWTSPVATATAAAVDGNVAGLVANRGGTVSTSWAPGDTLWVRWIEINDFGNDHGLAIDNVSFSVTAVPEPGTYALLLAGLGVVGFLARRRRG